MNYDCNRCQDRAVVGGFLPSPCPECRAADSDPLKAALCAEVVALRARLAEVERENERLSMRPTTSTELACEALRADLATTTARAAAAEGECERLETDRKILGIQLEGANRATGEAIHRWQDAEKRIEAARQSEREAIALFVETKAKEWRAKSERARIHGDQERETEYGWGASYADGLATAIRTTPTGA